MFDFSYANILHSNLINFVIMIVIIALILRKINVKDNIDNQHKKIKDSINKSQEEVKSALKNYENAKEKLDNVHIETEKIVENAKNVLENLEQKHKNELEDIKVYFEKNLTKEIEREKQNTLNDITLSVAKASAALSYDNIKQTLKQNPNLHQKYIDECINSIDGLTL